MSFHFSKFSQALPETMWTKFVKRTNGRLKNRKPRPANTRKFQKSPGTRGHQRCFRSSDLPSIDSHLYFPDLSARRGLHFSPHFPTGERRLDRLRMVPNISE